MDEKPISEAGDDFFRFFCFYVELGRCFEYIRALSGDPKWVDPAVRGGDGAWAEWDPPRIGSACVIEKWEPEWVLRNDVIVT